MPNPHAAVRMPSRMPPSACRYPHAAVRMPPSVFHPHAIRMPPSAWYADFIRVSYGFYSVAIRILFELHSDFIRIRMPACDLTFGEISC